MENLPGIYLGHQLSWSPGHTASADEAVKVTEVFLARQQSPWMCCGMEVFLRYLCSEPFAYRCVEVKSNKKVQWFFFFCIFKGELRQCCFFMIFLEFYGNCGAPAPLTAPGPADFAAGSTGEEPSGSEVRLGIPSFCEPLCLYFISRSHHRARSGHKELPQLSAHQHKALLNPGGL